MLQLQLSDVGRTFYCKISGIFTAGRIQFDNGIFYLCQDIRCGEDCTDKLGYRYSWSVGDGSQSSLLIEGVSEFSLNNPPFYLHLSASFRQFLRSTISKSKVSEIIYYEDRVSLTTQHINYLTNRSDLLSYLPNGKPHMQNDNGDWKRDGRQTGKPAKVIRKLFTSEGLSQLTDKDFEIFANLYKAVNNISGEFKVVSGSDIPHWYNGENYACNQSTLSASCMRDCPSEYFDIYAKNPDTIKMLILVKDDLLIGRALLWHFKHSGKDVKLMDRIYGTDATIEQFKVWAEDNGYGYKAEQNYSNKTGFIIDGELKELRIQIKLDKISFSDYPYVDTFTYISEKLSRVANYYVGEKWGEMSDTSGTYSGQEDEFDGRILDGYTGVYIDEEDAVFVNNVGYCTHIDNTVICNHSNNHILHVHSFTCEHDNLTYRDLYRSTITDIHGICWNVFTFNRGAFKEANPDLFNEQPNEEVA